MLRRKERVSVSQESLLLAVADRIFAEFDDLPARLVFDAFTSTRAALRSRGLVDASPQQIERAVRSCLKECRRAG